MSCNCENVLKTTQVGLVSFGNILKVGIPFSELTNRQLYDIIVLQEIESKESQYRVWLETTDFINIPLFAMTGSYLRSDQVSKGMSLPVYYGNDPYHMTLVCPIKCSSFTNVDPLPPDPEVPLMPGGLDGKDDDAIEDNSDAGTVTRI